MKQFSLVLFVTLLSACNNKQPQKVEPPCISDKVTFFSENIICTSGAFVKEYEFRGDFVYVFNHGNCISDHTETVVDYSCDTIGYLGGLAGNTEIDGKEFYQKAELQRTLFEN